MPRVMFYVLVMLLAFISPYGALAQDQTSSAQNAAAKPSDSEPAEKTESSASSMEALEPKQLVWPFSGMTGHVDVQAAQRGFQVYKQVCSACHSMNLVTYRNLSALGFSEAEIKAVAAEKPIPDLDDNGQVIQRPAKPSDHFPPPYPNEAASRAANRGAYPPDLSLIVKARHHGPDYVYSLLTGFSTPPASKAAVEGKSYNPYFPGHWISMPPPLNEGVLSYQDGTPATVDQMARDVVVFLQWAAEPEMQQRHEMGIKVLIFLLILTVFCYAAKKRVWRKIGH